MTSKAISTEKIKVIKIERIVKYNTANNNEI